MHKFFYSIQLMKSLVFLNSIFWHSSSNQSVCRLHRWFKSPITIGLTSNVRHITDQCIRYIIGGGFSPVLFVFMPHAINYTRSSLTYSTGIKKKLCTWLYNFFTVSFLLFLILFWATMGLICNNCNNFVIKFN